MFYGYAAVRNRALASSRRAARAMRAAISGSEKTKPPHSSGDGKSFAGRRNAAARYRLGPSGPGAEFGGASATRSLSSAAKFPVRGAQILLIHELLKMR